MKKYKKITLWCVVALCLVLTACGSENQTEEKPISIALTQDMLSFDPMQTSDIFSEAVLRCVYTSLYDLDDDLNLRPKLVKEAEKVDEYTWDITIHENVKFHDGSPLTTDDVIFSIERAMKGGRTEKLLEIVDTMEKISDTEFLISSKEPYDDFLSIFAKAETSIISKAVVETPGYDFSKPVGAGPFQFVSWEKEQKISVERFEDYYLEKAASKYLDFVILISEQDRTTALLNEEIDILFSVSAYDCAKLELSENVKLLQSPSTKIEYLSLNNNHKPLDNPKVRRAISYAIDRETIEENVYDGYSFSSVSLIPKGIIGYKEPEKVYDPDMSKQLLKEAGYEDGFTLNVITINTIRKNTLEYIKLDLAKVGIELNYELVTMQEAAAMMTEGKHESILVGWAFSTDPNSVLSVLLGTGSGKTMNSSNYSNSKIDELLVQARGEANKEKKRGIYETINDIVTEDAPIVVLQEPMVLSAANKSIQGIHFNPQGLIQYESMYRK